MLLVTAALASTVAYSMYTSPILETVPIDRLIANLEREYAHPDPNVKNTANAAERLARLHAFAYAQKADSVNIDKNTQLEQLPDSPAQIRMLQARDDQGRHVAQQHLATALIWYKRALDLDPTDRVAQLGYGWTLQESGQKNEAKQIYRKIIAHEMSMSGDAMYDLHHGYQIRSKWITAEALDYLIPLLHPFWDWRELKTRREQRKIVQSWGDAISPIIIPLAPDVQVRKLIRDDLDVPFNLDGSGPEQHWTWISPQAGWLVCDYDAKGLITSGRKLVGNVTFWLFWDNGFQVLTALDDNSDGRLTGEELRGFKIWRDNDCDGICRPGELMTLEQCGIVSLSTSYIEIGCAGRTMWMSPNGVTLSDGSKRDYYDVVLKHREEELTATSHSSR